MNDDRHAQVDHDSDVAALIRIAGTRKPIAPERADRVREAVRTELAGVVEERSGRRVRWQLLAASVAIAAIAGVVTTRTLFVDPLPVGTLELVRGELSIEGFDGRVDSGYELFTGREIATNQGSRSSILLQTGASVRLDSGTRIVFETPDRIRLSAGAVYVDSPEESATASLTIVAGNVLVREIGTQFETRRDGDVLVVSVREGRVAVTAGETLEIERGSRVVVTASGSLERRSIDSWAREWDWVLDTAPPFAIDGRPVGEFLDWIGRETGLKIDTHIVGEEFLNTTHLHGSIEGLTPTEAIGAVLPATGLEANVTDGTLTISRTAQ